MASRSKVSLYQIEYHKNGCEVIWHQVLGVQASHSPLQYDGYGLQRDGSYIIGGLAAGPTLSCNRFYDQSRVVVESAIVFSSQQGINIVMSSVRMVTDFIGIDLT